MKKLNYILILLFFPVFCYCQSFGSFEKDIYNIDSLISKNDVKSLRKNNSVYIVRGKREIEYLVVKVYDKNLIYYFYNTLRSKCPSIANLEDDEKFEIYHKLIKNR